MSGVPHNPASSAGSDVGHALFWGLLAAALVILGIYTGSRAFRDFDPALVSYAGASVFAAFGIGYRYAMWLRRPPTRLYWRRGWQLFLAPKYLAGNLVELGRMFVSNVVAQQFIERRSRTRWIAHWFIAWGCLLAAAVTFPLSFGWVRFETLPDSQSSYRAFVFGLHVFTFPLDSVLAPVVFNVLDVAAVMVLLGLFFAFYRRGRDRGALAVQQFESDMLPLAMLFAVSITGLFLTASTHLLGGLQYGFLSQLHAVTVIFTLLYLPFGKFFHIFQRPAQMGVAFYKRTGAGGEQARCIRCGEPFGSRLHVDDLKRVEDALGIQYRLADGQHYQDVCPACRRKNLAVVQDATWRSPDLRSRDREAPDRPLDGAPDFNAHV
jgi:hypothetical protein